jgi:hypothetical protein
LQMLLLAQIGLSGLADHHHDLNESHWRHRQALPGAAIYARVPPELSIFSIGEPQPAAARSTRMAHSLPRLRGRRGGRMLTRDSARCLRLPRRRGPLPDPPPQAGEGEESAVEHSFASEFY